VLPLICQISIVSHKSKEKTLDNGKEDDEESKEPDYDEDEDQLEGKQEEETGGITTVTATTNQVF
jgi:hypothetical protein